MWIFKFWTFKLLKMYQGQQINKKSFIFPVDFGNIKHNLTRQMMHFDVIKVFAESSWEVRRDLKFISIFVFTEIEKCF